MALIKDQEYHRTVDCTLSGLSDRLTYALCSKYEVDFIEDDTNIVHLSHPCLDHAQWVLYRINIFKPPPVFVIHEKDIPQDVASEFEEIDEVAANAIITGVVQRILESVNPHYFHTNEIYGKAKWKIDP
jgi:hypothetical protein